MGGIVVYIFWTSMLVGPILTLKVLYDITFDSWTTPFYYIIPIILFHMLPWRESQWFIRIVMLQYYWWHEGVGIYLEHDYRELKGKGLLSAFHPHGIVPFGFLLNGCMRSKCNVQEYQICGDDDKLVNAKGICAPVLTMAPLFSIFLKLCNTAADSKKATFVDLLKRDQKIGLLPGGIDEINCYRYQKEIIYIKKRTGFVKYCLEYGYPLSPAYTFGESELYKPYYLFQIIGDFTNRYFGFCIPYCEGYSLLFPTIPKNERGLHTVHGAPIMLPKIDKPTKTEVDHWHAVYIEKLTELFNRYKAVFGYADRDLIII